MGSERRESVGVREKLEMMFKKKRAHMHVSEQKKKTRDAPDARHKGLMGVQVAAQLYLMVYVSCLWGQTFRSAATHVVDRTTVRCSVENPL